LTDVAAAARSTGRAMVPPRVRRARPGSVAVAPAATLVARALRTVTIGRGLRREPATTPRRRPRATGACRRVTPCAGRRRGRATLRADTAVAHGPGISRAGT